MLGLLCAACNAQETDADADVNACILYDGQPASIVSTCDRALTGTDLDPRNRAQLLLSRGRARNALGQGEAAMHDLDEAVQLAPKDANIRMNRGVVHAMHGRNEEALRDLDAALALDPRGVLTLQNRAVVQSHLGRPREALADIERAMAIDDTRPALWTERCWLGAVVADDLPATLDVCERALAKAPQDPNNENNLGFVHFRMGHHALAIEHYTRSIAGNPQEASSYFVRGLSRRALGDADGAAADIAKGESLDPAIASTYARYGVDVDAK
jgi:tetratricopeptide (TPR) repeat protein